MTSVKIRGRSLSALFAVPALLALAPLVAPTHAGANDSSRPERRFVLHTYAMQTGRIADARPAAVSIGGPYTYWSWPDPAFYSDISEDITIHHSTTPGAPLFFSHQFSTQYGTPDDGGYVGLQDGSSSAGQKIALFSIWNATGMRGTSCNKFSGEGQGRSCRIAPFDWQTDRAYRVDVARTAVTARGTWWKATVTDTVTGTTSTIGEIRVPNGWGGLQGWTSWSEFFGDSSTLTQCSQLPHSRVVFKYPLASDGAQTITGHTNQVGPGQCRARIKDLPGAVQQTFPF
jgi:hypothetical protein